MSQKDDQSVEISIKRSEGSSPLNINLTLGGYNAPLQLQEEQFQEVDNREDIIKTNFVLDGEDEKSLIVNILSTY
jgi:hypothetical protein